MGGKPWELEGFRPVKVGWVRLLEKAGSCFSIAYFPSETSRLRVARA